jgi:hypothetical protein
MTPNERAGTYALNLHFARGSVRATEDAIAEAEAAGNPRAADYYRERQLEARANFRALVLDSDADL